MQMLFLSLAIMISSPPTMESIPLVLPFGSRCTVLTSESRALIASVKDWCQQWSEDNSAVPFWTAKQFRSAQSGVAIAMGPPSYYRSRDGDVVDSICEPNQWLIAIQSPPLDPNWKTTTLDLKPKEFVSCVSEQLVCTASSNSQQAIRIIPITSRRPDLAETFVAAPEYRHVVFTSANRVLLIGSDAIVFLTFIPDLGFQQEKRSATLARRIAVETPITSSAFVEQWLILNQSMIVNITTEDVRFVPPKYNIIGVSTSKQLLAVDGQSFVLLDPGTLNETCRSSSFGKFAAIGVSPTEDMVWIRRIATVPIPGAIGSLDLVRPFNQHGVDVGCELVPFRGDDYPIGWIVQQQHPITK